MTATPAQHASVRASIAEFLDLICADKELLRAEFDAIIAAGWPAEPPTVRGTGCRRDRPPFGSRGAVAFDDWLPRPQRDSPEVRARSRQRSPPTARAAKPCAGPRAPSVPRNHQW
jgi:hypothetical protein